MPLLPYRRPRSAEHVVAVKDEITRANRYPNKEKPPANAGGFLYAEHGVGGTHISRLEVIFRSYPRKNFVAALIPFIVVRKRSILAQQSSQGG